MQRKNIKTDQFKYPPNFYKYIIDSMKCGVITIDVNGNVTMVNDIACTILGLDGDKIVGLPCLQVLQDHKYLAQLLLDAFQSKSLPNRSETEIKHKDKGGKTIGFTIALIKNGWDEVVGSAIFFKDLSRIEQMEEQERLKERLIALGQMAAGLAHEIRNPLAGIEVTAGLLKRRFESGSEEMEHLENIIHEIKILDKTVIHCLEYVRPIELNLKPAKVKDILDNALLMALSRIKKRNIEIIKEYNPDIAPILLDSQQIKQVFLNIIMNAFEALKDGGQIKVKTDIVPLFGDQMKDMLVRDFAGDGCFDKYVLIEISDNGEGISAEVLDKLFTPFFTTKEKGSGVGLSIAQKIVNGHQGRIDVESKIGEGTHFFIKLPMIEQI